MLVKLHAERLLQVVRVLDELPKGKQFNLFLWNRCGTTACALGWAASDPWFKCRGLKLEKSFIDVMGLQRYRPEYKGSTGFWAATSFFSLAEEDAENLFCPSQYERGKRSKRNVIRRIKAFVKDNT